MMDAIGPRASRRSHELPDLTGSSSSQDWHVEPISSLYAALWRLPVPAGGDEPPTFALQQDALTAELPRGTVVRMAIVLHKLDGCQLSLVPEPAVGVEPTHSALRVRCSAS